MVRINIINPPIIKVKSPEGIEYTLNEYEFLDLRRQIGKEKAIGWTCLDNVTGNILMFDEHGNVDPYPKQMNLYENLLYNILDWKYPE